MAVDFKTEHTRTSEYLFLPEDIKFNPDLNGRHELPDIEWLITSMVRHGQLQPVSIKNNGGAPWLHIGHSRWRAGLEINRRNLMPVPFKLRCVYFRGSELDAFRATVAENRDRNQTTQIDDGHNIARFLRYNMTLDQIAEEYHEDVAWVKDRLSLIDLCEEAQKLVTNRELKPNAAKALAKLSTDAQKAKIASGEKLTVAAIRRVGSPAPIQSPNGTVSTPSAKRKWDKAEVCAKLQEWIDLELPPHIAKMDADNAIRTVLSQIQEEIECGGC